MIGSMFFIDAVLLVILLAYVAALGWFVTVYAKALVEWLQAPVKSQASAIRRLQTNWFVFRQCRIHLLGGTPEYWQDWQFDYWRIRSLTEKYLCTGE